MAGMITLTINLTSNGWLKIKQQADAQWIGERMSGGEIGRRYMLAGVAALKKASPADRERLVHGFQSSMQSSDERLRHLSHR
jgi:hypothetical protein